MKKLIIAALSSLMLVACGGGESFKNPPPLPDKSITIYGDSIMHGYQISYKPADKFRERGFRVVDLSAGGLSLQNANKGYTEPYAGAPADAFPAGAQPPFKDIQRDTKYVLIELGGNDVLFDVPVEQFEKDLREMVNIIIAEDRIPVLTGILQLGVNPTFISAKTLENRVLFNEVVEQIVREFNIPYADWNSVPEDTMDGIHPNEPMMNLLLEKIFFAIE